MHHYTAHTYLTFTNNPVLLSLWKEVVPQHAFQHRFLLKGMLSVAARHKLRETGDNGPIMGLVEAAANVYEQEALTSYIHLLGHVDKENCHALFAFSQLIVGSYYSRLSLEVKKQSVMPPRRLIGSIVDVFNLLKGTLAVAKEGRMWLRDGDLGAMVGPKPEAYLARPYAARNSSILEALSALSDRISGLADNADRVKSLLTTIQLLVVVFLTDCESEELLNLIVGLPIFFDQDYIRLLRGWDHASLVVLSYYGVALHRIRHVWCLEGVGAGIVGAVADLVGSGWSSYVRLPRVETFA